MAYPDPVLLPHVRRALFSPNADERIWAAHAVTIMGTPRDRPLAARAIAEGTEPEARALLAGWLARPQSAPP